MQLSDFDFDLPERLIATRPARPRSAARLLVAEGDVIRDRHVHDLAGILRPGDLLVLNNTRVLPVRLFGTRQRADSIARIEVTLLEPAADGWMALVKPLRKVNVGENINFLSELSARVAEKSHEGARLVFDAGGQAFDDALQKAGVMPLPPYIASRRPADEQDKQDYQTVFARIPGAVAAPTASLHFDQPLMQALRERGVQTVEVTLHVGAGTFLPVKVDDVVQHRMHAEWGCVGIDAARAIQAAKDENRRVIPVGTTALRLIESAAAGGRIAPWEGWTDIFIYPGYEFRVSDALMTNFHLPKSTLLMLVSALMGQERVRRIYDHAIRGGYRFFSYGDASLLIPD